jgi:hypothetical protein
LTRPEAAPQPEDALHRRVRAALARFTGRLRENGYDGYVGEVGWPDAYAGDADQWNALAGGWYADEANLCGARWPTGERWGTGHKLAPYEDRHSPGDPPNGVDSANTGAAVTEVHPSTPSSYLRGVVNVSGAEFSGTRSPQSP